MSLRAARKRALALIAVAMAVPRSASAHYERCTVVGGEDSCFAPDTCSLTDGGNGICFPPPCQTDASCRLPPLLRCDTRQMPAVCIECYGDGECTSPKRCELDPRSPTSNRCVECGLGRVGQCDAADKGHTCIVERGVCGCTTNADCPADRFCRRIECIPRPRATTDGAALPVDPIDSGLIEAGAEVPSAAFTGGGGGCSASPGHTMSGLLACAGVVVGIGLRARRRRARMDQK